MRRIIHIDNSTNYPFSRGRKEIITTLESFPDASVTVLNWNRDGKVAPVFKELKKRYGKRFSHVQCDIPGGASSSFSLQSYLRYARQVMRYCRRNESEGVMFWPHNLPSALPVILYKALQNKGAKVVYDVHDLYPVAVRNRLARWLLLRIDEWCARRADAVLVPTARIASLPGIREYYVERGLSQEKVSTVWNAPMREEVLAHRSPHRKPHRGFVVGYPGQVRLIEPFLVLADALASLQAEGREVELVFVGGGHAKEGLLEALRSRHPSLIVRFLPMVPPDEVWPLYLSFDVVFSVYALSEDVADENERRALQTKVIEAAALGVPSIVPRHVLSGDFVKKYAAGVPLGKVTPATLKRALLRVRPVPEAVDDFFWEQNDESLRRIIDASG